MREIVDNNLSVWLGLTEMSTPSERDINGLYKGINYSSKSRHFVTLFSLEPQCDHLEKSVWRRTGRVCLHVIGEVHCELLVSIIKQLTEIKKVMSWLQVYLGPYLLSLTLVNWILWPRGTRKRKLRRELSINFILCAILNCWSQFNRALYIQVLFPLNRQPIGRDLTYEMKTHAIYGR